MSYVDGYLLPVPKKNLDAYRRLARKAARVWKDHGALEYRECAGDDLDTKMAMTFGKTLKLKRNEKAIFAWIVYKSKAHRDRVNAKVMKDPRITKLDPSTMPFDMKRMVYGGFKVIVSA